MEQPDEIRGIDLRGDTGARLYLLERLAYTLARCRHQPSRVLDIGCGDGRLWAQNQPLLLSFEPALVGLDVRAEAVHEFSQVLGRRGEAVLGDARSLGKIFAPKSFDVVVSVNCLQYARGLSQVAAGVRQVLEPEGKFLFVIGNPLIRFWREFGLSSLRSQLAWWLTSSQGFRRYSPRSLSRQLARAGLETLEVRYLTLEMFKTALNRIEDDHLRWRTAAQFLNVERLLFDMLVPKPSEFLEIFTECRSV